MTNGEKIKEIFPDTKIITQYDNPFGDRFMVFTLNNEDMQVNIDWWNAEYKEPVIRDNGIKDELNRVKDELEPTTKSETLISLDVYKQVAWERDIAIQQLHELGYEFGQKIEPTTKIDYRRAFKIACELLNGDVLYGVDADDIYELMMKKDGIVSSSSYEEYILNHLQELDQGQYASEPTTKNDLGVSSGLEKNSKELEKNFGELDCISREDAINAVNMCSNSETILNLQQLPSVTPQEPRWIPVSEKLPNSDIDCLVTDEDGEYGVGYYREDVYAWDSPNWGWLERKDRVDNKEAFTEPCGIGKVVAWMPLPAHFEPQKSEDKE